MSERKPPTSSRTLAGILATVDLLKREKAIFANRLLYVAPIQYALAQRDIRQIKQDSEAAA